MIQDEPTSGAPPESPGQEAETTHDRLRLTALELFGERGYDGASMNELAERVGLAKPSLYNYYPSKEELLLDLVAEGLRLWLAECQSPFEQEGSYEQMLRDHLAATVEFARRHPHVVGVFHMASVHVDGELAQRVDAVVQEHLGPFRAMCDDRLVRAIAEGEIPDEESAATRAFLAVFFQGLLFQQTACPSDAQDTSENLPGIWRLLFRAISGREPEETIS